MKKGFLLIFLIFATAVSAQEVYVANTASWENIYSAGIYSALLGKEFYYLVNARHAEALTAELPRGADVTVIESDRIPYVKKYANRLTNAGMKSQTVLVPEDDANLDLAKRLPQINSYYLVNPIFGYDAISAAPLAIQTKSYVLFATKENAKEIAEFLSSKTLSGLTIVGDVDQEVISAVSHLNPKITNEGNRFKNNITIAINVKAYNDYFGNLTGNVTLDTNTNATEYDWRFNDSGNVIFTNAQVNVNFSALYALGRNISGGVATNDFLEADQALNMTGFNDSIQTLWATNASHPRQTTNFTVRGRTIENVPYINSTNTSNFITGILWQSVNSTSREFNATQKQPLLFVTMINRNQTGFYGRYDYEAHVPVLLRSYNSTSNALQYFVELK